MTETMTAELLRPQVGEIEWRCRGDEHDYQQMGRALIRATTGEGVTTNEYEPVRLYCRKCGWVRDASRF